MHKDLINVHILTFVSTPDSSYKCYYYSHRG
nr:MAG TPA: hypothetical protein [Caudoviricetes sp.]